MARLDILELLLLCDIPLSDALTIARIQQAGVLVSKRHEDQTSIRNIGPKEDGVCHVMLNTALCYALSMPQTLSLAMLMSSHVQYVE